MDFRKTFDKIPERFDKYRLRYCKEVFQELEIVCGLNSGKKVLEIGPGTGQATEPILKTGCDYTAIVYHGLQNERRLHNRQQSKIKWREEEI